MERIGVRELNQNTSQVLARVANGETLEVTERGRPIARLVPIDGGLSLLDRLVAGGAGRGADKRRPGAQSAGAR